MNNEAYYDSENERVNIPLLNHNNYQRIYEDTILKLNESPILTTSELLKIASNLQEALIFGGIAEAALALSNLYKNKFIESSTKLEQQVYQAIYDNFKNLQSQSHGSNISCIHASAKEYVKAINIIKQHPNIPNPIEYFINAVPLVNQDSHIIKIFINYPPNAVPIDIEKYEMEVVGKSCCSSCCIS